MECPPWSVSHSSSSDLQPCHSSAHQHSHPAIPGPENVAYSIFLWCPGSFLQAGVHTLRPAVNQLSRISSFHVISNWKLKGLFKSVVINASFIWSIVASSDCHKQQFNLFKNGALPFSAEFPVWIKVPRDMKFLLI